MEFTLSEEDKRDLKVLIKQGILRCCEKWLEETSRIITKEYDDEENAFDRCMNITQRSRDFHKEAMRREDYYRTSQLVIGAANLLGDGYLTEKDFEDCSEELTKRVFFVANF